MAQVRDGRMHQMLRRIMSPEGLPQNSHVTIERKHIKTSDHTGNISALVI